MVMRNIRDQLVDLPGAITDIEARIAEHASEEARAVVERIMRPEEWDAAIRTGIVEPLLEALRRGQG
jgi:hypothetical protein